MADVTESDAELKIEALKSVTRLERSIWGQALAKQVTDPSSRFRKNLPKFGPAGSARLVVGGFWLGPGIIVMVLIFPLDLIFRPKDAFANWIMAGMVWTFAAVALYRGLYTGIRSRREYQRQQMRDGHS